MPHAVLLGDSIFDNAAYVAGGPDVAEQLRQRLPQDWQVTLLAQDGAVSQDVVRQIARLPADATHLLLSAGGNDALRHAWLIRAPQANGATLLSALVDAQQRFRNDYQQALRAIDKTGLPLIGCTIYDAVPGLGAAEKTALSIFNDVVTRELLTGEHAVVDLRQICTDASDYSAMSPIEPSEVGGAKIAQALQRALSLKEPRTK
jgi:lysophospholipase L1-like esterase